MPFKIAPCNITFDMRDAIRSCARNLFYVIQKTQWSRTFVVALGLLLRNIITLPRVLIKMAAAAIAAAEVAAEAVAEAVAETAAGKNK